MLGLPTSEWRGTPWSDAEALADAPLKVEWRDLGVVEHVFTHFALTLRVFVSDGDLPNAVWTSDLSALPSVFLKAARLL